MFAFCIVELVGASWQQKLFIINYFIECLSLDKAGYTVSLINLWWIEMYFYFSLTTRAAPVCLVRSVRCVIYGGNARAMLTVWPLWPNYLDTWRESQLTIKYLSWCLSSLSPSPLRARNKYFSPTTYHGISTLQCLAPTHPWALAEDSVVKTTPEKLAGCDTDQWGAPWLCVVYTFLVSLSPG